ncbi:hypothetical protein [Candidatus Contubernalis alkaliaceticus]|uniref:hypothetical protein n=1 Tax=Candidatus Contubernalis alkaliaceticus TaxID=338645 RepID=UPI001F4BD3AB|nr:hypothetical protein [Candidatus Contubernalis alkalaceticus]UNC91282.1 hypothetical protein HUE98_03775 [Candidatus Contubernalis alkalaceticus]
MRPLWVQSEDTISEDESIRIIFMDNPKNVNTAKILIKWLKIILPFRCGIRMGKERITFLAGNYRPAAIKRQKGSVRLDMVFANRLPEGFNVASDVWRSVPNTVEGYILADDDLTSLTEEDIGNFVKACEQMLEVAPKSRRHLCNVSAVWPDEK